MRASGGLLTIAVVMVAGCTLPHWPVSAPMTSPFGLRMDGWLPEIHRGVDLAAATGTPVHAMSGAIVEFAGAMTGYGNVIILRHNANTKTVYAHLSRIDVQRGARVRGEDVIGLVGATGNASGPHLHFEVWRWGHAEDPVPLLGGRPKLPRR